MVPLQDLVQQDPIGEATHADAEKDSSGEQRPASFRDGHPSPPSI
jgi:hypothetical protein